MNKLIFSVLLILPWFPWFAYAEETLWDQMPNSMEGRYKFFEKNDSRGVFKSYKSMRGTRYIFACVNAQVFYIFANQQDWVKDVDEADQLARKKCDEIIEIPINKNSPPMKLPLGTPVLLKFEKDYKSFEGYMNTKDKWTPIGMNDQSQLFAYNGKQSVMNSGNRAVWILSNYDKNLEFASAVSLREVDCRQRKFRINKLTAYSEKYGFGKKLQDYESEGPWQYAPPGSLYESILDFVCH